MSEQGTRPVRDYYVQHGQITDPGKYSYLFDDLPHGVQSLVKTVQGLVVSLPWEDAYGLDTPRERHREIYLRTIPEMLKRILARAWFFNHNWMD